jgi:hypothetical protein
LTRYTPEYHHGITLISHRYQLSITRKESSVTYPARKLIDVVFFADSVNGDELLLDDVRDDEAGEQAEEDGAPDVLALDAVGLHGGEHHAHEHAVQAHQLVDLVREAVQPLGPPRQLRLHHLQLVRPLRQRLHGHQLLPPHLGLELSVVGEALSQTSGDGLWQDVA